MPRLTRFATVLRASDRTPLLQVVKTAAAATLAWIVCILLIPAHPPIFAVVAAILVVQPSINQSFSKALERSVGVIIGVVLAFGAGALFGPTSWVALGTVVVALLVGWALRLSQSTTAQIPISVLLVLTIGAQTPGYALERILETVIGAVIAVVVNVLIVPPVKLQPAHDAIAALGDEVASTLDGLAALLRKPSTPEERTALLIEARLLRPMETKAADALASGEESLRFNPRGFAHRTSLDRDRELLRMLRVLVLRVPGMVRALDDHYDSAIHLEKTAAGLATELGRAAHDLRLVLSQAGLPGEVPVTTEIPALTAPFSVITPSAVHWILIGSLLEDLRRVREVVVEGGKD